MKKILILLAILFPIALFAQSKKNVGTKKATTSVKTKNMSSSNAQKNKVAEDNRKIAELMDSVKSKHPELANDDPFSTLELGGNWNELPEETKNAYRQAFKKQWIEDWGKERAEAVAMHLVEIGFTEEQLRLSQGDNYTPHVLSTPHGKIVALEYPWCTYYLKNDKLFALIWDNGVQIGDIKLIQSHARNRRVITKGNR